MTFPAGSQKIPSLSYLLKLPQRIWFQESLCALRVSLTSSFGAFCYSYESDVVFIKVTRKEEKKAAEGVTMSAQNAQKTK